MILQTLIVSVALATIGAVPGLAQVALLRPAPSSLFRAPMTSPATDTLHLPRTYWQEGALVAGTVTGVLGFSLVQSFCMDTDSGGDGHNCGLKALSGLAFGFLLGAIPGALIGGQFEKR